jgi:AcrR family transcriptional regulator
MMDDLELFALGGMTNRSDAMFERRRRILSEARKMIGDGGLEGFNIRELGRRADVAQRTIYNAFGSKENVMALAIRQHFESLERHLSFNSAPGTFLQALEHQVTALQRDHDIPNYVRAVAALYFSPTIHPNIRQVLVEIGGRSYLRWLRAMELKRLVEKGVDVERVAVDISNLQYAKVHEWGIGALGNEAFFDHALTGVLLLLAGATRGAAHAEVRAALIDFHSHGALSRRLVAEARARIATALRKRPPARNTAA